MLAKLASKMQPHSSIKPAAKEQGTFPTEASGEPSPFSRNNNQPKTDLSPEVRCCPFGRLRNKDTKACNAVVCRWRLFRVGSKGNHPDGFFILVDTGGKPRKALLFPNRGIPSLGFQGKSRTPPPLVSLLHVAFSGSPLFPGSREAREPGPDGPESVDTQQKKPTPAPPFRVLGHRPHRPHRPQGTPGPLLMLSPDC